MLYVTVKNEKAIWSKYNIWLILLKRSFLYRLRHSGYRNHRIWWFVLWFTIFGDGMFSKEKGDYRYFHFFEFCKSFISQKWNLWNYFFLLFGSYFCSKALRNLHSKREVYWNVFVSPSVCPSHFLSQCATVFCHNYLPQLFYHNH